VEPDNETHAADGTPPRPAATTLGELRASGHEFETVKEELRRNLLARMRAGENRFPGIVGFDQTVLPHVERALLAGHDTILLGERGQGKTRLIRTLSVLLDDWTPAVAGCEINDHPYQPVCARCQRLAAELGDDLPVSWRHRSERYGEKLATPDTSVGDLIGDIDPVKVAEAASSASTSFPTWPSGSRSHCSTCWRNGTSGSAATRCGCRWTWSWWPAPTRRTTPTAAGSSPR
jgi:hypothetical protein